MEQIQKIVHLILSFFIFMFGSFVQFFLGSDDIRNPPYAQFVFYILFFNAILSLVVGFDLIDSTLGITDMMGLSDDYDRFGYEKLSVCDDILNRQKGLLKLFIITLTIPKIVGFIDWYKKGGLNNKKSE